MIRDVLSTKPNIDYNNPNSWLESADNYYLVENEGYGIYILVNLTNINSLSLIIAESSKMYITYGGFYLKLPKGPSVNDVVNNLENYLQYMYYVSDYTTKILGEEDQLLTNPLILIK